MYKAISDLPWKTGFGGVLKCEINMCGIDWTILECDDSSYSIYGVKNRCGGTPTFEGLDESQVLSFVNELVD